MSITVYDDNFIEARLKEYQKTRYSSGVVGVYDSEEDLHAAEEYDNGYETGRDEGFFDGYVQCLKDLGVR